jgi:hypothetical protein
MKTVSRSQGKEVAGAEWYSSYVPSIAAGQLALVLKKNVGLSRGKSDWSAAVGMETECNPMRERLDGQLLRTERILDTQRRGYLCSEIDAANDEVIHFMCWI